MQWLKDSSIYIVGEVFSKSIPFLLLPYIARKLGPFNYGELANIQVYIVLCLIFLGLSQDGAITRYFYRYGRKSIGLAISSGMVISLSIFICICLYALFTRDIIVFYIACAGMSQNMLSVQLALRQCQKEPISYASIQLVNGVIIAIVVIALFETVAPKYEYYVVSIIIANVIACAAGFIFNRREDTLKFIYSSKQIMLCIAYLLSYGLPLIFHQLSFFLKGQFDRLLVIEYYDAESLGIYAAAFQLASVFSVLLLAINKATVPYYYEGLSDGTLDTGIVLRWVRFSLLLVGLPAFAAFLIPESIYVLILGSGFTGVKHFTVFFLLGLGLNIPYFMLVSYLFYLGDNKNIALASTLSSLLHVVLLYGIVRYSELIYLPGSLFISNIILVFMLYRFCKTVGPKHA